MGAAPLWTMSWSDFISRNSSSTMPNGSRTWSLDLPARRISPRQEQLENQPFDGAGRQLSGQKRGRLLRDECVAIGLLQGGLSRIGRGPFGNLAQMIEQLIQLLVVGGRRFVRHRFVMRLRGRHGGPRVALGGAPLSGQACQQIVARYFSHGAHCQSKRDPMPPGDPSAIAKLGRVSRSVKPAVVTRRVALLEAVLS